MNQAYSHLRKQTFLANNPFDFELIELVKDYESHQFLVNRSSHLIYLYLTQYVKNFSEFYFRKNLSELLILDWGCGKGHITFLLQKLGANLISCDLESNNCDSSFGQETPIIKQLQIPVQPLKHSYQLPYADHSIDICLSFGVLEHVKEDLNSLKEINRVLSPQGLLFVFFLPFTFSWTQNLAHRLGNYYHDRLYSKRLVRELLAESNFTILDIWHRQLLPKNRFQYPYTYFFERCDQFITNNTPLKLVATNIEFVAYKNDLLMSD